MIFLDIIENFHIVKFLYFFALISISYFSLPKEKKKRFLKHLMFSKEENSILSVATHSSLLNYQTFFPLLYIALSFCLSPYLSYIFVHINLSWKVLGIVLWVPFDPLYSSGYPALILYIGEHYNILWFFFFWRARKRIYITERYKLWLVTYMSLFCYIVSHCIYYPI